MARDEETGINHWAATFDRAREALRYSECQALLAGAKSMGGLHGEAQAIVWHCQANWLRQLSNWDEAVERYERSLRAFRAAGNKLGEGQVLSDLGNVYQAIGWRARRMLYPNLPLLAVALPQDLASTINNGCCASNPANQTKRWKRWQRH